MSDEIPASAYADMCGLCGSMNLPGRRLCSSCGGYIKPEVAMTKQHDGGLTDDYFLTKRRNWLESNKKLAAEVRWGGFPLGMVRGWIERAEYAEAQVAQLKTVLREYGKHNEWCGLTYLTEKVHCTCGLAAALTPESGLPPHIEKLENGGYGCNLCMRMADTAADIQHLPHPESGEKETGDGGVKGS